MRTWSATTFFTADQACNYGLVDRVISEHEFTRAVTGFRTESDPAKIGAGITPGDDRLRRGRIVGVVASRGSREAS